MRWLDNLTLAASGVAARLHWGLRDVREPEKWAEGIRLLDAWTYFDRPEPRLGRARWVRFIPPLAKGTGVYHYRLGIPHKIEGLDASRDRRPGDRRDL